MPSSSHSHASSNNKLNVMCSVVLTMLFAVSSHAQEAPSAASFGESSEHALVYDKWKSDMATFEEQDKKSPPLPGSVLFVGSSSIRFWSSMHKDFNNIGAVMNRGFGGSTMSDCNLLVKELVVRYKPRQIIVYAGENDLAEGRTPQQVLASLQAFVTVVRKELPKSQLAYISIKPSPSRVALMTTIRETNALLAAYVGTLSNAEYIDVFTPMLDKQGSPKEEFFLVDMLHMNASGYALWQSVVGSYLTTPLHMSPQTITP